MRLFWLSSFLMIFSCASENANESSVNSNPKDTFSLVIDSLTEVIEEIEVPYIIDTLEQSIIDAGLINIQEVDSSILVDLKYSTEDNFMNKDVYGHMTRAYLQKDVAEDLAKCQA